MLSEYKKISALPLFRVHHREGAIVSSSENQMEGRPCLTEHKQPCEEYIPAYKECLSRNSVHIVIHAEVSSTVYIPAKGSVGNAVYN